MRSRVVTCLIATTLLTAPAILGQPAVQAQDQQHYPYVLVDVGTFGGPSSYLDEPGNTLNESGAFIGSADSTIPDPNPTQCGNPDCLVSPGFKWQNGNRLELGPLPGGASSAPFSVNQSGMAAGVSQNGLIDPLTGIPENRAVTWQGNTIRDLGTLGGNQSFTQMLNDSGQVIGWALNTIPDSFVDFMGSGGTGKTQMRAVLWQGGQARDLGTLGGEDAAAAFMNDHGQITGQSFTNAVPNAATGGSPTMDPFFWDNGRMVDMGTLGGTIGFPNAINSRGQVIGQSDLAGDQSFHPFLWSQGSLKDLGTLGGDYGAPNGINDLGQVVGWATTSGNATIHPVLWQNGGMHDLGLPLGYDYGFGNDINPQGQVVGNAGIFTLPGQVDVPQHALLWDHGTVRDLNTLVAPSPLIVNWAVHINNLGEIAATGVLQDGSQRAVLLIPSALAGLNGFTQNVPGSSAAPLGHPLPGASCPRLASWFTRFKDAPARSRLVHDTYPACFRT
jgi:probable HAF family extracellular repeat protein